MNIGDLVGLVETVIEDGIPIISKVPAIVTKVYENVHGEVVADLHKLATNVESVIAKEANPAEALPPSGLHVTTDLTPPPSPEEQKQSAAVAAQQQPTPAAAAPAAPTPQLTEEEKAFSALSAEDQAAFMAWQKAQAGGSADTGGTGAPTP